MKKKKLLALFFVFGFLVFLFFCFFVSKYYLVERISVRFQRGYQVAGFLPYWTVNKNLSLKYDLLDQIIYFSFDFNEEGNLSFFDKAQEQTPANIFNGKKFDEIYHEARIHETKVLIAITCFDRDLLAEVLFDEEKVEKLTNQIVDLVSQKNLDGVNVDFEFESGTSEITEQDFANFIEVLSYKLKEVKPEVILSADFYADAEINNYPYDFELLDEYLDQFFVMTYDYHRRASEF
nr:hypothetical protein [Candidatus Dadabacteria bacterium]